jgi:hypothetical protein
MRHTNSVATRSMPLHKKESKPHPTQSSYHMNTCRRWRGALETAQASACVHTMYVCRAAICSNTTQI